MKGRKERNCIAFGVTIEQLAVCESEFETGMELSGC